jgi:hypothetical protein
MVTSIGTDVIDTPSAYVVITWNEPVESTTICLVVSPVDHKYVAALSADKIVEPLLQIKLLPWIWLK